MVNNYEDLSEFLEKATQTSSQLVDSEPIAIPYLIDPLIIRGNLHLLTGPIGNMKSYLSLGIAGKVAAAGSKVVFVDKENSLLMVESRARALELPKTDKLVYWCERPSMAKAEIPPDFRTGFKLYEKIIQMWKQQGEDVVIFFDTLNRFSSGGHDENSVQHMAVITERLIALRNLGATVIALHQVGKPSENGYRDYRGSSEIAASVDIAHTIKGFRSEGENSASFTIQQFKTRWLPHSPIQTVFDLGNFYFLPDFLDIKTYFSCRQSVTRYLAQSPNAREDEIKEVLSSRAWGNFPKQATNWLLNNCRKNYWMKTQGKLNSFVYSNIPSIKNGDI